MTIVLALCVAVTCLALTGAATVIARGWLRPDGVFNVRRYTLYAVVLTVPAAILTVTAVAHHSWFLAAWSAAMSVLLVLSVIGKARRAGPTESAGATR